MIVVLSALLVALKPRGQASEPPGTPPARGVFQSTLFRFQASGFEAGDRPPARLAILDRLTQKGLLLWPTGKTPFRVEIAGGKTIHFAEAGWHGAPPPGPDDQVFAHYYTSEANLGVTWQAMRYPGKDYVQIVLTLETYESTTSKPPVIKRVELLNFDAVGTLRRDLPASPFISDEFFFVTEQPKMHFETNNGHVVVWSPYQKPLKSIPRGFLKSEVNRDLRYLRERSRSFYSVVIGVAKSDQLEAALRAYTSSRYAPGVYYFRD